MTATSDPYAERHARAEQLGWTWVSDHSCPRKLAGRRCRNNYDYGSCWCVRHQFHLNDHGATWRDKDCALFVLWEPYHAVFAITLAAMGATVMLERDSNARMVLELQLAAVQAEIV